jgi:hypothetical protein
MSDPVGLIDDSGASRIDTKKEGDGKSPAKEDERSDVQKRKQGDGNEAKFRSALQIRTQYDGCNSGRQYTIQAQSGRRATRLQIRLAPASIGSP